jgi:hypothetical protein
VTLYQTSSLAFQQTHEGCARGGEGDERRGTPGMGTTRWRAWRASPRSAMDALWSSVRPWRVLVALVAVSTRW